MSFKDAGNRMSFKDAGKHMSFKDADKRKKCFFDTQPNTESSLPSKYVYPLFMRPS